jgi:hypothetical protein
MKKRNDIRNDWQAHPFFNKGVLVARMTIIAGRVMKIKMTDGSLPNYVIDQMATDPKENRAVKKAYKKMWGRK